LYSETAWFLKMNAPQSFGMLGSTHPVTVSHPRRHCCQNFKFLIYI